MVKRCVVLGGTAMLLMFVVAWPAQACFSCSPSNPKGVGEHNGTGEGAKSGGGKGWRFTPSEPKHFRKDESGSGPNGKNNACECSKGGNGSKGKTGGDMGY